jgi:flagellar hook protein FlgE
MSLLPIAAKGLANAEEKLERAARRLAQLPSSASETPEDVVDLSAEMVSMLQARTEHAANAKVAETAQEIDQHLLDLLG